MHTYTVHYNIHNTYENPVNRAFYQLLVLPQNTVIQKLFDYSIDCSLKDSEYVSRNVFGFKLLQFTSQKPISEFHFQLQAMVEIEEFNPFGFISESPEKENALLQSLNFQIDQSTFLMDTPLTHLPKGQADQWPKKKADQGVFDFLRELNQEIHSSLTYAAGVTHTKTTSAEVSNLKQGVCQDYTHLFISIARASGIPARYTSGYLNQGSNRIGTTQTHAWAEAFIPFIGWIGFDPTNNLLVDHHYIKIAHGTDYKDCSPITGVLDTSGEQTNTHTVSIINQ